jgi:hypothetical protein
MRAPPFSRATRSPRGRAPCPGLCGASIRLFHHAGRWAGIVLGEQVTPKGERVDIQYKGSGKTPFSRQGDGRAALGPMLREYIISEAMHALGIPTTRSLAVVTTGEPVFRETALQGAILTRTAASHIRVGTFEYAAAMGKPERGPDAGRLHHPPPFPDLAADGKSLSCPAWGRHGAAGLPGGPLAAGWLHPRCHEHGQHGPLR